MEARDGIGASAYHLACEHGHVAVVRYLVEQTPLDINAQNSVGNTALHRAARRGHYDVCWALLMYGAKNNMSNEEGLTAKDLARKAGNTGIAQLLAKQATDI